MVGPGEEGRLDRFVADRLELSRTRVQALVAEGRVLVDGRVPRKSERVEEGSEVVVEVPPAEPVDMLPEDLPLSVVFEDEHLLVVDKAAGMTMERLVAEGIDKPGIADDVPGTGHQVHIGKGVRNIKRRSAVRLYRCDL